MTEPDATLSDLLAEMVESKKAIREVLKISPEEVQLHRIFGMYAGQILDIRKVMLQEQEVDQEQLLLDALQAVVQFLFDHNENQAAQFIGDHLEDIGMKVSETWQNSKRFQSFHADIKTSANLSAKTALPSAKPRASRKKSAARPPCKTSASSRKPTSRTI